jgi:hypothetical protein
MELAGLEPAAFRTASRAIGTPLQGATLRLYGITRCGGFRAFSRLRLIPPASSGVTRVDERRAYPYIC